MTTGLGRLSQMRIVIVSFLLPLMMGLAPVAGFCAGLPDLSAFKQPSSRCVTPSDRVIVTKVGTFQGSMNPLPPVEIVATTRPGPDDLTIMDHATIHIFDSDCHLVYQQTFPESGEVTFETMNWDGQPLLHLTTISAVGEPVDETIFNHIILAENYDGSFMPVQPPFLVADNYNSVFVGDIGHGRGFGIVESLRQTDWPHPNPPPELIIMFQFKTLQLPKKQAATAFVGPTVITDAERAAEHDSWPFDPTSASFPLMHFLFPG